MRSLNYANIGPYLRLTAGWGTKAAEGGEGEGLGGGRRGASPTYM